MSRRIAGPLDVQAEPAAVDRKSIIVRQRIGAEAASTRSRSATPPTGPANRKSERIGGGVAERQQERQHQRRERAGRRFRRIPAPRNSSLRAANRSARRRGRSHRPARRPERRNAPAIGRQTIATATIAWTMGGHAGQIAGERQDRQCRGRQQHRPPVGGAFRAALGIARECRHARHDHRQNQPPTGSRPTGRPPSRPSRPSRNTAKARSASASRF